MILRSHTDILTKLDELNSTHEARAVYHGAIWALVWVLGMTDDERFAQELAGQELPATDPDADTSKPAEPEGS